MGVALFIYLVISPSHPGCSIDPLPEVMQELQSFERRMPPIGSDARAKALEEWRKIYRKPQTVRVLGISFDTRFAKVLVTADYDLKKLADDTDTLDVPRFTSILDMRIGMVREAIARNQRAVLSPSTMNRFWFYPDDNLYEESEGIVLKIDMKNADMAMLAIRNLNSEQAAEFLTNLYLNGVRSGPKPKQ